jgi:hypothetical protein
MCENVLNDYVKNTNKDREMLTTQGKNIIKVTEREERRDEKRDEKHGERGEDTERRREGKKISIGKNFQVIMTHLC